MPVFTEVIDNI